MAMKVGKGKGGPSADINMTPMIDIMLVLLIIFMVVQVGMQQGLSLQVPPERTEVTTTPPPDQIVLEVSSESTYLLNSEPIQRESLRGRLTEVYAPRPRKVIFVKGAESVSYSSVIFAVDAARAAGVEVIGLVPRR